MFSSDPNVRTASLSERGTLSGFPGSLASPRVRSGKTIHVLKIREKVIFWFSLSSLRISLICFTGGTFRARAASSLRVATPLSGARGRFQPYTLNPKH